MKDPASYRRAAAATSLVIAGVSAATFMVLAAAPGWGSDDVERLQAVAGARRAATVSFVAFVVYQLPLMIGLLGVAHLMRGRAPLLASLGGTLAAVGAFGYAVYGGSQLVIPAMAADPAHLEVYAQLRSDAETLTVPFAALGMVGSVLGLLVLSIALWRTRVGPRWVPVTVWAFLAVEFVGTSLSPSAARLSAALLLVALTGLAVTVRRSPVTHWSSGADSPVDRPAEQAGGDGAAGASRTATGTV